MSTSTIPAVRERLVELLQNHQALFGVQVLYADNEEDVESKRIAFGDTTNWNREFVGSGPGAQIEETYSMELLIWMGEPGNTAKQADDALHEMHDAATEVIRSYVTAQGEFYDVLTIELKPTRSPIRNTKEGFVAWIEAVVEVNTQF